MEENQGQVEQPQEVVEENSSGSMYGKFKDATSMLKAYQNLEAEFTRKSQRLSALEKQLENQTLDVSEKCDASTIECEESEKLSENTSSFVFENSDWQASVAEFFKENPEASEYKSRMSRIIYENPEYAKSPKCLELAFKLAKSEGLKRPAELACDQQFINEYILSDSRIKDLIITEYISSLSHGGTPKIISGSPSVQVATAKADLPKSIKEAGMLAKKFFG